MEITVPGSALCLKVLWELFCVCSHIAPASCSRQELAGTLQRLMQVLPCEERHLGRHYDCTATSGAQPFRAVPLCIQERTLPWCWQCKLLRVGGVDNVDVSRV